jgi:hypothetical protein
MLSSLAFVKVPEEQASQRASFVLDAGITT